jgi:hypothetical protein
MPGIRRETSLDLLVQLQHRHTKIGKKFDAKERILKRGNALPARPMLPTIVDDNAPKSSGSPQSLKSNQSMGTKDSRPLTAPVRMDHDLLAGFDFDATQKRPWTADPVDFDKPHVRLGSLVQIDGDVGDVAHKVVEDTTAAQLKESSKVFNGLCERIDTAYEVKIEANNSKQTTINVRKKKTRFVIKGEKATGGLIIIMDPRSALEDNLVTINVQHNISKKIVIKEQYYALGTGNTFNLELTTLVDPTYEESKAHIGKQRSYPGWNGRPPIWIPTTTAKISLKTTKLRPKHLTRRLSVGETFKPKDVGSGFTLPKPPISANFMIFNSQSPKHAILLLRSLQEKLYKSTVEHLTIGGGIPAINIACLHGNKETVEELIRSGANPNSRRDNTTEYTPLHEAVLGSHSTVVISLLHRGGNQSLRDARGNTPLHLACMNKDIKCIRALLSDSNQYIIRRSLNSENLNRLKPHQVCDSTYCRSIVEDIMRTYNLAVRKARVPLALGGG